MPIKDPERARQYHRERRAKVKTGFAQTVEKFAQTANPGRLESVSDLRGLLAALILEVRDAKKTDLISRARCIGTLANVLLTCFTTGDFEARLAALEASATPGHPVKIEQIGESRNAD
jgi:hypothetical protein